ncbi:PEP-CTERM sorting domain-containing protein [Coraliomargarita algicola]|uniref:PEP-CTERM sorting domain-containing protein n=1 Tax=Coraliomargarita algicola TaxID=3092156 RepID=A0ABZ0RNB8_9BACT|nr:PEP-CTERM sorting domain-containing protein [Coraliomargarita sp. J2-16]WPJ96412.1 PEP-CTERM sorting domain-containing protein [Coraliomargarita sp. J2-16]
MKTTLITLTASLLLATAAQASTLIYSDTFDNDGLATNTGTGGGLVNNSIAGTKSWADDGNLQFVIGTGSQYQQRAMAYSENGFQSDDGFELSVSYFYTSDGGDSQISFGLVSDDTNLSTYAGFSPYTEDTSVYSFGVNTENKSLVFTNASSASILDTDTGTLMDAGVGAFTVDMSITADGSGGADWSWSIGGVDQGSGNIAAFDFSKTFHFVAYGQDDQGNKGINSVSISAIPEPSSYALLAGILGLSYVMVRRRN